MEFKPTFITALFLLLVLLDLPFASRGGSEGLDSEIYEIDYRGPETHTSIPSPYPTSSKGKPRIIHRANSEPVATSLRSQGLEDTTAPEEEQVKNKNIHG